jgi:LysR family glycine cleavage system transcriptional activator
MRRSLPPLNALRSFEAAARHQSFTRAAHELCVTQGAVSHQVKALETELGRFFLQWCMSPIHCGNRRGT